MRITTTAITFSTASFAHKRGAIGSHDRGYRNSAAHKEIVKHARAVKGAKATPRSARCVLTRCFEGLCVEGRHTLDPPQTLGRPLAREDPAHDLEAAMTARRSQSERLAVLEQKVSHMEAELGRMSAKVDEMHAVLMQARGVRWAIIAVAGLVGFLAGLSHWLIARA